MEQHRIQVPRSSCLETWVFIFLKKKESLAPQIILSNHSFCFRSTKAMLLPSFHLSFNQAYVELRIGVERHACFAYVAKSKTISKKKQDINLDQDVQVCGYIFFFWVGGV